MHAQGIWPGATIAKPAPQILVAEGGLQAGTQARQTAPDSASDATGCLFPATLHSRCRQRQRYLAVLPAMTSCVSGTRRHEIAHKPGPDLFLITVFTRPFRVFRYLKVSDRRRPWLDIRGTARPSRRYYGGASGVSPTCGAAGTSVSTLSNHMLASWRAGVEQAQWQRRERRERSGGNLSLGPRHSPVARQTQANAPWQGLELSCQLPVPAKLGPNPCLLA